MLSFSSALKQSQTHTLFSSLQKLNQILVLSMLTSSSRSALFLGSNVALVLLLKKAHCSECSLSPKHMGKKGKLNLKVRLMKSNKPSHHHILY